MTTNKNKYNPKIHHRRSIRLKGYDYSQSGFYFITICVKHFWHLFGHIEDEEMILNDAGKMVEMEWLKVPDRFPNTQLHAYVVMPNHFHAILQIRETPMVSTLVGIGVGVEMGQPQGDAHTGEKKTVGDMVGAFQSIVTVKYIRGVKEQGWRRFNKKLWHRNYWEHIIRTPRVL